jgi:hypothetical protein
VEIANLVERLSGVGASLEHPVLGVALLLDREGEQLAVPVDRVARLVVEAEDLVNIQFWFAPDDDLTVSFFRDSFGVERQTYYLDGLAREDVDRVAGMLLEYLKYSATETVMVVLDRSGATVDFDWDEIARGSVCEIPQMPDKLLVSSAMMANEAFKGREFEEFYGGLVICVG